MRVPLVLLACLVLGSQVIATPLPSSKAGEPQSVPDDPLSRDWKRLQSEHFIAVGDASESQLRDSLMQLEQFRSALVTIFPHLSLESPVPTVLVLFKSPASMAKFRPRDARGRVRENVAGYFNKRAYLNRMVTAVIPDREAMFEVLQHEYTHYVMRLSGRDIPSWIDEGLAEFYGTFKSADRTSGLLGSPPKWRVRTIGSGEYQLPFDEFFTSEGVSRTFRSQTQTQRFYSMAWGLVHYMLVGDRAGQLGVYLNAVQRGASPQEAFQETFKVSYGALQLELSAYLRRFKIPARRLALPPTAAASNPVERMTEVSALQTQAELLLELGADDEAEPILRKALALDAAHVDARRALAMLRWQRQQPDDALMTIRTLAAEAPKNFATQLLHASYSNYQGEYETAMRAADAAIGINKLSPDAWFSLSVSASALGREAQASGAMMNVQKLYRDPDWYRSRAHILWSAGNHAGVTRDVEAFAEASGWGNERIPYTAFLGTLSYRKLGQEDKAAALVARAAPCIDPKTWTASVAAFLGGTLTAERFLDLADGIGEETEAHGYIGVMASIGGRLDEARRHLEWVRDRGARNYTEYRMSVAELRRLDAAR
jgi:tetratricopeptide (TPR) repeat protein